MSASEPGHLSRELLLDYFVQSAKPREQWRVGMEVELMGRLPATGKPLPFDGEGASVREVLEFYRARRASQPIWEADHLIGLDGSWGSLTLEPGGQIEWSSRPCDTLDELFDGLRNHLELLDEAADVVGVRWLDVAVDPVNDLMHMEWVPKARYKIMRPYLGQRGRLAHRMMSQTASIQCAFDYGDAGDWARKFRAAAWLSPVATALFANSDRIDGAASGYRSYRQAIWRETDPDRCGLPPVVFEPDFDLQAWLDWVLRVPTIFRHRARGMVPAGGVPFVELLDAAGCEAVRLEDWETHVSTVFTEVRSYSYLEIRSADLQPRHLIAAVPALWTGLLYDETTLDAALELGTAFSTYESWSDGMDVAAREGLDGRCNGRSLRELARSAVELAQRALPRLQGQFGGNPRALDALQRLAHERRLSRPG